jgi:hypothetical protein
VVSEKFRAKSGSLDMAKFTKGQSGNPSGKPKGCRNATTILFDELLKDNAKELIEKAIEMAKDGDGPALRLCIDRLAPARKDRPVWFDLPEMKEARDAVNASAAIVAAVANGDLTPMEASELGKLIESYARTLQAVEFEERLSKLEKAISK